MTISKEMIAARPDAFAGMRMRYASTWFTVNERRDDKWMISEIEGCYYYAQNARSYMLPGETDSEGNACPPDPQNADWVPAVGDEFWLLHGGEWCRYTVLTGGQVRCKHETFFVTDADLRTNALRIPREEKASHPTVDEKLYRRGWRHDSGMGHYTKGAMAISDTEANDACNDSNCCDEIATALEGRAAEKLRLTDASQLTEGDRLWCGDGQMSSRWWSFKDGLLTYDNHGYGCSKSTLATHIKDRCCLFAGHPDAPADPRAVVKFAGMAVQVDENAIDSAPTMRLDGASWAQEAKAIPVTYDIGCDAAGPTRTTGNPRVSPLAIDPCESVRKMGQAEYREALAAAMAATPPLDKALRYSEELDPEDWCDYAKPEAFVSKCWRHPDGACPCRLEVE